MERRLERDVLDNDIAYIPCKVGGIDDIISKFSVRGCESLDSEFMEYITDFIEFVPPDYPVILQIYGPRFSPGEKKIICDTIQGDMAYLLGRTETVLHEKRRRFWGLTAGTLITAALLTIMKRVITDAPLEFFYVLFWLYADALVRYLFLEKMDFKEERIRVGRLASIQVEFVELGE